MSGERRVEGNQCLDCLQDISLGSRLINNQPRNGRMFVLNQDVVGTGVGAPSHATESLVAYGACTESHRLDHRVTTDRVVSLPPKCVCLLNSRR